MVSIWHVSGTSQATTVCQSLFYAQVFFHARVISMPCLPQLRRRDDFGKPTLQRRAGPGGHSSSRRQAGHLETHLVPSSGCHASLSVCLGYLQPVLE